ncbi:DUF4743 domain-containing protein, partial [Alphaproteobacteria bacterium]|nr:DUF4743 domain-containing protein [Alphaproteobacteria bacterium]
MSFLDRINECHNAGSREAYLPFCVGNVCVGWVHRHFVPKLGPFGDVFVVGADEITLAPGLNDYVARTQAVEGVLRTLDQDGHFAGWRDERYPVGTGFLHTPLFEMERTAVPRFGVAAYGVHVHGFVRDGADISLWIGRRADDKPTYPGKLDQMIAGGQPVNIGLLDNVIKEAREEAAVSPSLAATAKPVGAISYCHESDDGLKPDVMFIYDLELPRNFV